MNRELQFRAWSKKGHLMLPPATIAEIVNSALRGAMRRPELLEHGADHSDLIFMQYTGLQDSFGTKIFEGDIVYVGEDKESLFERGVIKFGQQDYPAFEIYPTPACESNALHYFHEEGAIKVVGNVFENIEMLEKIQQKGGGNK